MINVDSGAFKFGNGRQPGRTPLDAGVISSFTSETIHSFSLIVVSASHLQTLNMIKFYLRKCQPIVISNGRGGGAWRKTHP